MQEQLDKIASDIEEIKKNLENQKETKTIPSPLREEDPEFYGQLLKANQKVADSSSSYFTVALILGLAICLFLGVFSAGMDWAINFRNFWSYASILVVLFWLQSVIGKARRKIAFQPFRIEIMDYLQLKQISANTFLAKIEHDTQLASIAEQLRKYPGDDTFDSI